MLVHICCSVDSHFFLQELRKAYPNEKLIGFFYDPNIHPYSEYELRYFDVKRSCDKLNIKLIKGEYDYESWLSYIKGFEDEPERGKRCKKCFDFRMEKSVQLALKLKEKCFTTTLLASPKKDLEQLNLAMKDALKDYELEFLCVDFRKNGGTQRQLQMAKEAKLYHQNYCGCIYGLIKQKSEEELIKELSSSIYKNQVLPASAEDRIKIFKQLKKYEDKNIQVDIIREKFLNYRLLYAKTFYKDEVFKSVILFYSHFKSKHIKLSLDSSKDIIYSNKDEICFVSFSYANKFFKAKDFNEFYKNPPSIKKQIEFRKKIFQDYNLSPIIILNTIPNNIQIFAKSIIFQDIKLKLIKG